jgi:hypothetical protein
MIKRSKRHLRKSIAKLSDQLPIMYPTLDFENHCYRRMAYDTAVGMNWTDKYPDSFVMNASREDLALVEWKLKRYMESKQKLLEDNSMSLKYRGKRVN